MKRFKSILLIALAVMLLMAFVGCGSREIDWEAIKRDDVVAEVNGIQLTKKLVNFQYCIEDISSQYTSSFYSQLGGTEDMAATVTMDKSMDGMLANLILASIAKDNGMTVAEEKARESSYDEYILSAKKYDYLSEFSESMKQNMYLSDEMLVQYGTEYNLITDSADEVVRAEFDKLDAAEFEDLNAMSDAVLKALEELTKDVSVTVNYPSKHTVKGSSLDFSSCVTGVKWDYSSLFQ